MNLYSELRNLLLEAKELTNAEAKLIAQAGGMHTKKSKRLGVWAKGGRKRGRAAVKKVEKLARRIGRVERTANITGAPLAGRGRGDKFRTEDDPEGTQGSGARIKVTKYGRYGQSSKDKNLPRQGTR